MEQDALFRYVAGGVLGKEPTRTTKASLLKELKDRGVFLIDVSPEPLDGGLLARHVADLISRCKRIAPARIILIKATVYDAAFGQLRDAGLPVVDERISFPGSGRQREFEIAFARALGTDPTPKSPPRSEAPGVRRR